jgi:hypothetical protein
MDTLCTPLLRTVQNWHCSRITACIGLRTGVVILRDLRKDAVRPTLCCLHDRILYSRFRDSVLIRSNEMQHYAGVYLLQNHSTCFGCLSHPSSGVHQTVIAASVTGRSVRAKTFRQRGLIRPRWRKVVALTL